MTFTLRSKLCITLDEAAIPLKKKTEL